MWVGYHSVDVLSIVFDVWAFADGCFMQDESRLADDGMVGRFFKKKNGGNLMTENNSNGTQEAADYLQRQTLLVLLLSCRRPVNQSYLQLRRSRPSLPMTRSCLGML